MNMTKEEFINDVMEHIKDRPSYIRKGQAVFNYVDNVYGVARIVQFNHGVDCFYTDDRIDDFLNICYKLLTNNGSN